MKNFLKLVFIAIIIFIVLSIVTGIYVSFQDEVDKAIEERQAVEEVEPVEYVEVQAGDIINLYENNELQADEYLKDRRGIIIGKVYSIERILGQVSVTLQGYDEWGITMVSCNFDDNNAKALTSVNKGDTVKIEGTIKGKGWNIDVDECILR